MGQKVHASGFRLGVPVRGLKGRHAARMTSNPMGSKDMLGWSVKVSGSESSRAYGEIRSEVTVLMEYIKEFLLQSKLVVNRCWVDASATGGARVYLQTVDPLDNYTEEVKQMREDEISIGLSRMVEMMETPDLTRRPMSIVSISQYGVKDVCSRVPGWSDALNERLEKTVKAGASTSKGDRTPGRGEDHLRELALFSVGGAKSSSVVDAKGRSSGVKETKELARVTSEGLAVARMGAGVLPLAQGVSERVAMMLEDSTRQMDAITDIKKLVEAVSEVEGFGLMDLATLEKNKQSAQWTDQELEFRSMMGLKPEKSAISGYHGYLGYRIEVKGVIDGSRRTRKEVIKGGMEPNSTITTPVDFGQSVAKTKVGTRGVRVFYYYM